MSQFKLPHIASRVLNKPLLLEPGYARTFFGYLGSRLGVQELRDAEGQIDMDAEITQYMEHGESGERLPRPYKVERSIAVIPVVGTLVHKLGSLRPYSGMTGYDGILRNVEIACQDPGVRGILFDMDSPGGEVAGCFDTVLQIRELVEACGKPLWASCFDMSCSAAMALSSAASGRLITKSGITGSVGVLMAHISYEGMLESEGIKVTLIHSGAHKVDGNPYEDLPDTVLAEFQRETDELRTEFADIVAQGTGRSVADVMATEARCFRGQAGIDVGFADQVINGNDAVEIFSTFLSDQGRTIITPGGSSMKTDKEKQQEQQAQQEQQPKAGAESGAGAGEPIAEVSADAVAKVAAQARTDERERISTILDSEHAQGKTDLAHHLAFETDMEADKATGILAKSPVAASGESASEQVSRLDQAMATQQKPNIGPGTGGGKEASKASEMIEAHRMATGAQRPAQQ